MSIDEVLKIEYGNRVPLKRRIKFFDSLGRVIECDLFSGVKSKVLNKSLFQTNLRGNFDFVKVSCKPAVNFGGKKYNSGALVTTDKGGVLFIPKPTMDLIQKRFSK